MSDIFHEVEEEVRRERFEQLWKRYGDYVIAAVALIIIAIAAYELWTRYEDNQRLKASETLIAAQQLADSGDLTRANPAYATVAKDAPGGYAEMARLSEAGALAANGRTEDAATIFRQIAAQDDSPIGKVALVRAGWALADSASRKDLEELLAPVTDPASPWHQTAREILAYADLHAGDEKAALAGFAALAKDKDASDALRHRADAMAAFLKGGGARDFGTVPLPAAPPAAPTAPAAAPPAANGAPKP